MGGDGGGFGIGTGLPASDHTIGEKPPYDVAVPARIRTVYLSFVPYDPDLYDLGRNTGQAKSRLTSGLMDSTGRASSSRSLTFN